MKPLVFRFWTITREVQRFLSERMTCCKYQYNIFIQSHIGVKGQNGLRSQDVPSFHDLSCSIFVIPYFTVLQNKPANFPVRDQMTTLRYKPFHYDCICIQTDQDDSWTRRMTSGQNILAEKRWSVCLDLGIMGIPSSRNGSTARLNSQTQPFILGIVQLNL